ncbi:hypothetical protein [Spirosoma spitsbergense]|uniref:hypothetical protein n=1 Tax=Spirosoma spitsbergense TaxID=431554 RepID=UPI0003792D32|nr:hypothetical protein [Spirosoma spitsbergense]
MATQKVATLKPIQGPDKNATYPAKPFTLDETILRQAILDSAAVFVGMTEINNNNDAPWITKINRYNGLPIRSAYCASGYYYAHRVNGVKLPVRALGAVASYFSTTGKIIYRKNQRGNQRLGVMPRRMDAVSIYTSHIEGLVSDVWDPDDEFVTLIGFNTSGGRGTKYGCYINRRKKSEIKFIANWLTPYLATLKPP